MVNASYYSDREFGPRARVREDFTSEAWGGIQAAVNTLIAKGAFGDKFPEQCSDGFGPVGTNEGNFIASLNSVIPDLEWPVDTDTMPSTVDIIDLIEFCHSTVAAPTRGTYHEHFQHYHLRFDIRMGQAEFRSVVNQILARSGLVYELKQNGMLERMAPPVLREALTTSTFSTGEAKLDELLETARSKFLDPGMGTRIESLEKLWDAWERLKTMENPGDKRASIKAALDRAANSPRFRKLIEDDAVALTGAGNNLMIRHSEINKEAIANSDQVDYLFHRLYAMIHLILASRNSV